MKQSQFESLTKSQRNLNWAYRNFDNYDMYHDFNFTRNSDSVSIKTSIFQYGYFNDVAIVMNDHDASFKCDCFFCAPNDACGHVLASILLFEDLDIKENVKTFNFDDFDNVIQQRREVLLLEKQKKDAERALLDKINLAKDLSDSFKLKDKKNIQKIVDKKHYHLEFEIRLRFETKTEEVIEFGNRKTYEYSEVPYYEIKAKIGHDKLYVIKNFESFFEDLASESFHSYGAKLEFHHSHDVFETVTQDILSNLEKLYLKSQENFTTKREIFVEKDDLSLFFETFKDYPSEYLNFDFEEIPFEVQIHVEEQESLYRVFFHKHESLALIKDEFYDIQDASITKLSIDNEKLKLLMKNLYWEEDLLFSSDDLNNVLHHLDAYENLEVFGFIPFDDYVSDVLVYIDVEHDSLIIKGVVLKKGLEYNLFSDDLKTFDSTVDKVRYILESYASEHKDSFVLLSLTHEKTYRFLEEGLSYLEGLCTVYADESLKNIQRPTSLSLSIGVTLDNNLLDVDISSMQFDKDEINRILDQYRRKKKYYKLKSGEIINLESNDLKELNDFVDHMHINPKELNQEHIKLPLYRSLQMQDELSELKDIKIESLNHLENFNDSFKHNTLDSMTISQDYQSILKDYQSHGVRWMKLLSTFGFHGILADDMGLGKTLQVIALLESLEKQEKQSIVICPASLLFNWEEELKKFDSTLSYICIHGKKSDRVSALEHNKDKDLIITTYDYLRSDILDYKDHDFNFIIIDEAQYIKNQKTQTAKAVKGLKGDHRLALTGTPIENSLAELWSIFDFLMPGYLYTYPYFRTHFEVPIVRDNDIESQKKLRAMVEPFILRRIKKDVLKDLPEKIEKVLTVEFEEEEEKLYLAKLAQGSQEVSKILNSDHVDNILILKLLSELRQICCDPRLLFDEYKHVSSKMKACIELVEPLQQTKQKVLIFSSFTSTLDLLEIELKKKGIKYHMLTGKNTKEERKDLVNQFQSDDSTVFLISLRAAGVGLNLTAAEVVIHFDPWWNVAAENQASDRAHRIGQKNHVQVFKLIMKNSIEEKIVKMQEKKKDMADIFVEGASGDFASLSKDDILDLFKR